MGNVKKSVAERTRHKRQYDSRMNERQMQSKEGKVDSCKALDASLVVTECSAIESENSNSKHAFKKLVNESSGIESGKLDTSSSSGNYLTHVVDAAIRLVNDQVPSDEVHLTAQHNVLANEQQHSVQSEPSYDTHPLENIDSNTTPDSTNMCHRGGETIQNAEQYQVTSPLLNTELVKSKEMIEKEKYSELSHSVKEASNESKVKNDIDVIETINIELEHSVNKDNSDSLISQINQKSVEIADLKAQIQEKVFANAALKNELRKLKGNSVDTKFVKASILGKPPLQPSRNHSFVRQSNAFKSVRPRISKPRFASQVDVKHNLPKPVTPHYLPNFKESAPAKPHHVDSPSSSRNCQKESYGFNDIAHNHFLKEARKKTQDINWNLKLREMPSARTHHTPSACTPKPRSNNQTFRNWPASKSSNVKLNVVQKADHSRNPSSCLDSKHLVCSTCQKCVFNANHDDCITKFLKEVNSRAKVQSPKTRNNNKPVKPKSHTQKPGRQIAIGQRFSLNKSFAMHEKPNTPRSCLRWKLTGRIFKTASLRWIPTGKMFTDSTTKVDSEPPNGSNDDITNPYECDQTLKVSAGTLNLSAGPAPQRKERCTLECALSLKEERFSYLRAVLLGIMYTRLNSVCYIVSSASTLVSTGRRVSIVSTGSSL
ncbi:hypothetical protein Tco_1399642 [Tanacetum coccineum]